MNIKLPPEQLKWLEAEVAAGRFASVDEALTLAVADLMTIYNDDLAWAKPYVDEALASVERGDVISGEEFFNWLDGRLKKLRTP
jgi:antitoxin ParD1/3/4